MTRRTFANEARLALEPDTDPRAPGGAVTVELCGHWEHEGPCRWPHHTRAEPDGAVLVVRTVFAAEPEESPGIVDRIDGALRAAREWQVHSCAPAAPTPEEQRIGERWYDTPIPD